MIDGHSSWSRNPKTGKSRADIILGNRNFRSCDRQLTQKVKKFFEKNGFSVSINKPFSGKYILEKYCEVGKIEGLQLEINRKLYLNEKTLRPKLVKINKLNKIIAQLVALIAREIK